ncbi:hypothetical protein [Brumimicrobium glaciale]|nr:hypothetical protein [Brumimicrobium glaciale]
MGFKMGDSKIIKGICIKTNALDYFGNEDGKWFLEVGKEYEFLSIRSGIKEGNHATMVVYADKINDYRPSGLEPIELFEIDLDNISEIYHTITNSDNETIIEIEALSDKHLNPIHDAFWEVLFNEDEKVNKVYFEILDRLGFRLVL